MAFTCRVYRFAFGLGDGVVVTLESTRRGVVWVCSDAIQLDHDK
jgi:hypothetical protein